MLAVNAVVFFAIVASWIYPFGLAEIFAVSELHIALEDTDVRLYLEKPCKCKYMYTSLQLNYTTYSVLKFDNGTVECRFSESPVPRHAWQERLNSYTVHQSDYILRGEHFFGIASSSSSTYMAANSTCENKGEIMPVLFENATKKEFRSAMAYFGLNATWIRAFRDFGKPAIWTLANGTAVGDDTLPKESQNRCYNFDVRTSEGVDNSRLCGDTLPVVCQRDY